MIFNLGDHRKAEVYETSKGLTISLFIGYGIITPAEKIMLKKMFYTVKKKIENKV